MTLLTNYFWNSDVANVAFDMAILKSQRALANLTCLLDPGCYKHSYLCKSELKHVYLCTGCVNCALGVEYCLLHLYEWTSLKRCCDGLLPSSHCDKISEDMEFWRVVGGVFDEFDSKNAYKICCPSVDGFWRSFDDMILRLSFLGVDFHLPFCCVKLKSQVAWLWNEYLCKAQKDEYLCTYLRMPAPLFWCQSPLELNDNFAIQVGMQFENQIAFFLRASSNLTRLSTRKSDQLWFSRICRFKEHGNCIYSFLLFPVKRDFPCRNFSCLNLSQEITAPKWMAACCSWCVCLLLFLLHAFRGYKFSSSFNPKKVFPLKLSCRKLVIRVSV